METKTETKTRNSFKKFICNNISTIVVSSLTLAGGCAVGYAFGHTKGCLLYTSVAFLVSLQCISIKKENSKWL